VEHLIALGHTRIAHLSGPLYADTALRRLEGYRLALLNRGIEYNPKYVIETKYDEISGYSACKELLKTDDKPTAICAANDLVAIGAMQAINEAGLNIPRDISLVGYNDIWVASKLNPPLTTIQTPLIEMGEKAFAILLNLFKEDQNSDFERHVTIDANLIVRGSTARNAL